MKQSKRGFTIVELVIVIAVIAVLAAVLIPTFSSLIKKANLSADMQAVREMNIALAAYENLHNKPEDVETVMQVLADAGFHTDNWKTLTAGYEVYWYKNDNRMVLYSAKESKLIYPTEYDPDMFLNQRNDFWMYNQNTQAAETADTTIHFDSSKGGQTKTDMTSSASTESEKAAINSIDSAVTTNAAIRSALGLSDNQQVYFNGSQELVNEVGAGSYATMYITQMSNSSEAALTSSGDVKANMVYISVNTSPGASSAEITAAKKAASEYVYTAFVQINSGKFEEDVSIIMPAGTEIDASAHEWKPVKHFSGYFGTPDASNPIIINGAKLSSATGYLDTVYFDGDDGKYFVTGFFGCVYGNATIENVILRNLNMDQPGSNYDMSLTHAQHSRNSVGIIGGVIDDPREGTTGKSVTNVTLRNITVENNVTIKGAATAAGLVGYVGASGNTDMVNKEKVARALYNGTLTIENCHVSATVIGGPESGSYGPCGGIVGFSCRAQERGAGSNSKTGESWKAGPDSDANTTETFNIIIKDCVFDGKVTGYQGVGAAIGDSRVGSYYFYGTNDFTGAQLTSVDPLGSNKCGVVGEVSSIYIYFNATGATVTKPADMPWFGNKSGASWVDASGNPVDQPVPAAKRYDTVVDKDGNPIGANNGIA